MLARVLKIDLEKGRVSLGLKPSYFEGDLAVAAEPDQAEGTDDEAAPASDFEDELAETQVGGLMTVFDTAAERRLLPGHHMSSFPWHRPNYHIAPRRMRLPSWTAMPRRRPAMRSSPWIWTKSSKALATNEKDAHVAECRCLAPPYHAHALQHIIQSEA